MYFSDKEKGTVDRVSEDISIEVWNGIVSVFEEFKSDNSFSSTGYIRIKGGKVV